MEEYRLKAFAKINLGLDVVGRLPDGYHQVRMIMQNIGIYDELTLRKAEASITVTTDSGELPTDEGNLVYRAAKLMFEKYGIGSGIRIHLQKNIPIAAGLAGGSADAAAAMLGICRLFGLDIPLEQLMQDGVSIGADVPYCILGGTALAEGIGEKLTPLPPIPPCYILVAKPEAAISTKYVYEHLDALGIPRHPDISGMEDAIRQNSLPEILERMENVLEAVTIPVCPVIASIKEQMRGSGALNCLMSGSGPTVFGIFTDQAAGQAAYRQMKESSLAKQVFLTTPICAFTNPFYRNPGTKVLS